MTIERDDLAKYAGDAGAVLREAYPDAVSIIWKGSSYKPWDGPFDFIPGLSDLDLHVYRPGGLERVWQVRRALFDAIGTPPGDTPLQLLVVDSTDLPQEWTLLPGTYEVLSGNAPNVTNADDDAMRERDRKDIVRLGEHAASLRAGVLDRPDDELWAYLRSVRWMFPTVLSRAASVAGHAPSIVWSLNRSGVLELTRHDASVAPVRMAAIGYFEAAVTAAAARGSGTEAESALRAGHDLLIESVDWLHRSAS